MKKKVQGIVTELRRLVVGLPQPRPMVDLVIEEFGRDSFLILISCLLSLRAKDSATWPVVYQLFQVVKTPQQLLAVPQEELERRLYSIGFYRQKTKIIRKISYLIQHEFGGKVPASEETLLSLPGVGRKTANLVLGCAFGIPAICVDVHVHRIANRLDLVNTKTVEETEKELKRVVPQQYWIELNRLLVTLGQNICTPRAPYCSLCPLRQKLCPQRGVKKAR